MGHQYFATCPTLSESESDIHKSSFFPQTIRDWNSLTDSLLSAAEGAEDSVAKFTSLVRVETNFPNHRSW